FQVDLEQAPKAIGYTISARARGDLVVQFGNMKVPPFDSADARNELRQALNAIPGVHIASRDLARWPKIPIATFEDPDNLLRLVAVLDHMAEAYGASQLVPGPIPVAT
ncbi:MAG TPA: hypothetical protein VFY23_01655, partial [Candidatus Limnocylindrales bacterium]|nr:hypothetical protein [Candidatus Limnocylindrales bacterium]